ncbi:hypothetical protein D6833_02600 [Candidatus Parcubacteria bacterium]|nr:MAG: hypothetical protein D6833_02600 [Candidatus Parcubacteria bacterium]
MFAFRRHRQDTCVTLLRVLCALRDCLPEIATRLPAADAREDSRRLHRATAKHQQELKLCQGSKPWQSWLRRAFEAVLPSVPSPTWDGEGRPNTWHLGGAGCFPNPIKNPCPSVSSAFASRWHRQDTYVILLRVLCVLRGCLPEIATRLPAADAREDSRRLHRPTAKHRQGLKLCQGSKPWQSWLRRAFEAVLPSDDRPKTRIQKRRSK